MDPLAFRTRRAVGLGAGKSCQGGSIVELVVAVAVVMAGLLAFSRALTESLALGVQNRETALATAAAQGLVEELYATDVDRVFALYNDEPDDDPDGSGTAPGSRFTAAGLVARPQDGGQQGRIFFPASEGSPGELREDLKDSKLRVPLDLDLDGAVDDVDHSGDYRILPVLVRVAWQDGKNERELEVATILGGTLMPRSSIARSRAGSTLVEVMVVLALLSTFVGSLFVVGSTSTRLCETGVTRANLESSARRALDRLARELSGASSDSLGVLPESPLWQEGIDFDRVESIRVGDGRITWSADRAEFRLENGESDDGLDNDGNGLVDEGALVLVQDAGGAGENAITLAHGVREYLEGELANGLDDNGNGLIDERGVTFERAGSDLRLYLTLEGLDRDGRIVTRTLETTIWSRN